MRVIVLTALAICALSLVAGQAILSLTNRRTWSWLAPAIGFAALSVVSTVAVRLPGEGATARALLAVIGLASLVLVARRSARPSLREPLVVTVAMFLLLSLPFLANGRTGTLGVSINGDLAGHLLIAESLRSGAPSPTLDFSGYPLGAHALAAAVTVPGSDVEVSFTALVLAVPLLTALTALAGLRDLSPVRQVAAATLVGLPYLVAAYVAQASFKEPIQALLVLGFALGLRGLVWGGEASWRGLAPLALLTAGMLYTYSYAGLLWPAAILACWAVMELVRRRGLPEGLRLRPLARYGAITVGLIALIVLPELDRLNDYVRPLLFTVGGDTAGGNIAQSIPPYEAFGIWFSEDFRASPENGLLAGALVIVAIGVALYGTWRWALEDLAVPAALAACALIDGVLRVTVTPYFEAKALVIAAPLVMLVGTRALFRAVPDLRSALPQGARAAGALGVLLLALGFAAAAIRSTTLPLRAAQVGPRQHDRELATLRPLLAGQPTLFLGQDDYAYWKLRGARLATTFVYLGRPDIPFGLRPEKPYIFGVPFDFDALDERNLDRFRYVVIPRAALASEPPSNWRRVRRTRSFDVWERTGATPPRRILAEGHGPGAFLDCSREPGRRLRRGGGIASVIPPPVHGGPAGWRSLGPRAIDPPVGFGFATMRDGDTAVQELSLPRGAWDISLQYVSPTELFVRGPGLRATLPPYQERSGPYWPVGRVISKGGRTAITVTAPKVPFVSVRRYVQLGTVAATRAGAPPRRLPLRRACRRYVDWYVPASAGRSRTSRAASRRGHRTS